MIFYDIKSLTWYPTISWTVCETRIFFADFRGENYNKNTTKRKTITFVKRESNLFNGKIGEKIQFRAKIGSGSTGGRSRELYEQRWNFFGFKMEPDFPNFFLNLDFQDSENKTPNKRI